MVAEVVCIACDRYMMEVFHVNSLLELRQLRQLFRTFPDVLFTGGYVSVRVEVHAIDRVVDAVHVNMILDNFVVDYNCEVPNQEQITDVSSLADSLVVLKRIVDEATRNVQLFDERRFQMLDQAAQIVREEGAFATQIVREEGAFATGSFGDLLFSVTKTAVSCANAGQELLADNYRSTRRWVLLTRRLVTIEFDVDHLLRNQVLL